jgi:hypothetical protein
MKNVLRQIYSLVAVVGLVAIAQPGVASGAEAAGVPQEQLERLERRINELAQRQEQLMRQMSAPRGMQAQVGQPVPEGPRPQLLPQEAQSAARNPRLGEAAKSIKDTIGLLFLVGIVCNILLAIWIFTDIRKRGEGSGIFVALALVAGIPTAIIYSLVRIGDRKA